MLIAISILICVNGFTYYEKIHALAAKAAILLVKKSDASNSFPMYKEIYSDKYSIEIGRGAWREDWDPLVTGNERATRHFYDPDKKGKERGLYFQYYFYAWGPIYSTEVTAPAGDYYENAMDWARDGAGTGNPYNWKGAIDAYDYTEDSKEEAYYRLGHVVHLLADMAEPDHAASYSHPGSGYILPDDITKMVNDAKDSLRRNSEVSERKRKAYFAMLDGLVWYFNYRYDFSQRRIGFEGLIEASVQPQMVLEYFTPEEQKKYIKSYPGLQTLSGFPFTGNNIQQYHFFDDYFLFLAREAKKALAASKLPLALGLEDLDIPIQRNIYVDITQWRPWREAPAVGIPLVPTIPIDDQSAHKPYFDIAWSLLAQATDYSAGLLTHFYDVVNQPPFVQKIKITQSGGGRYEREWLDIKTQEKKGKRENDQTQDEFYDVVTRREMKSPQGSSYKDKEFTSNKRITVRITFGPEDEAKQMHFDVKVTAGGRPVTGRFQNEKTWEGSFSPKLAEGVSTQKFPIQIEARDAHYHYPRSGLPEREYPLDSQPGTPAKSGSTHPFVWTGYEKGADTNHEITVEKSAEEEEEEEGEEEDEGGWGVFNLTNVSGGSLWVGKEANLEGKFTCDYRGGGNCPPEIAVKWSMLAGPFDTRQEANDAWCNGVTDGPHYPPLVPGFRMEFQGTWYWAENVGVSCPKKKPATTTTPKPKPKPATPTKELVAYGIEPWIAPEIYVGDSFTFKAIGVYDNDLTNVVDLTSKVTWKNGPIFSPPGPGTYTISADFSGLGRIEVTLQVTVKER